VDQVEYGTNRPYLVDFINLCFKAGQVDSAEIKQLFLEMHWSATQIARKFGVSKSLIIHRLHRMRIKVETGAGRMTKPDNYRHWKAPYGYRIFGGKLLINRQEIKICRMVVHLIERENFGVRETARELIRRSFKNKQGEVKWSHFVVQRIYDRWKGKL
jgi:hypothetical protein